MNGFRSGFTRDVRDQLLCFAHAVLKSSMRFMNLDRLSARIKAWVLSPCITKAVGDVLMEIEVMPLRKVIRYTQCRHEGRQFMCVLR